MCLCLFVYFFMETRSMRVVSYCLYSVYNGHWLFTRVLVQPPCLLKPFSVVTAQFLPTTYGEYNTSKTIAGRDQHFLPWLTRVGLRAYTRFLLWSLSVANYCARQIVPSRSQTRGIKRLLTTTCCSVTPIYDYRIWVHTSEVLVCTRNTDEVCLRKYECK